MTKNPIELDRSPQAVRDRMDRVASLMAGVPTSAPTVERDAARNAARQQVEREELEALKAAAAKAEAGRERARILSVVRVGLDLDRPHQALRLALLGPVSTDQAKSILPSLTLDRDALDTALAIGQPGTFGTAAQQAERLRISTIFGSPEAQGRFKTTCALVLESDEAIPSSAVTALLASLPVEAVAPRWETIEERAAGLTEFGDSGGCVYPTKSEGIAETWSKAIAEANAGIGAVDPVNL